MEKEGADRKGEEATFYEEDGSVILQRRIKASQRSISKVNETVNARLLKRTGVLIEIFTDVMTPQQLTRQKHLEILDDFVGKNFPV